MAVRINIITRLDDFALRRANAEILGLGRRAVASSTSMAGGFIRAGAAMEAFGARSAAAGRVMTRYFTVPLAIAGGASIKFAMDYSKQMTMVQTQTGATAKDVRTLSDGILHMKDAQHGPAELAKAMYHLKSVGMDNVAALQALKVAESGASVGNADLEQTATALAGAWRSGIKGAQSFRKTLGAVNAIVGAGNMRLADLVSAIGTGTLATFKTVGLALRDFGAALAVMTDQGIPATAAATRLRMTVMKMAAPTDTAAAALKGIGMGAYDLAQDMRKPQGLLKALEDLAGHLKGLSKVEQTKVLSDIFGGGRTSAGVLTLIGNLGLLGEKYDKIGKVSHGFWAAVLAQSKTTAAKWAEFKATAERMAVVVGNDLMPTFERLMGDVEGLADRFGRLSPKMQDFIVKAGIAVAVLGPLLRVVGALAVGGGRVTSGIGLLMLRLGIGGGAAAGAGAGAAGAAGAASAAGAGTAAAAGAGCAATAATAGALIPLPVTIVAVSAMAVAAIAEAAGVGQHQPVGGPGYRWVPGPGPQGGKWVKNAPVKPTTAEGIAGAIGTLQQRINVTVSKNSKADISALTGEIVALGKLAKHPLLLGDVNAEHSYRDLFNIRDQIVKKLHVTVKQADDIMGLMFKDWDPKKMVGPAMQRLYDMLAQDRRKLRAMGKTLSESLAKGILDGNPDAISEARALASGVTNQVAHAFKEHSPSQVAIHQGRMYAEGIAIGIERGSGRVYKAVRAMAERMLAKSYAAMAAGRGASGAANTVANLALGKKMAAAYGWTGAQWNALYALWNRESGWRTTATNPSSGAYGIPQSLPASKMASAGADWRTNPATQIAWGLRYIKGRYGSPAAAWAHETRFGWYGSGGDFLVRRPTIFGAGESGPEHVRITPAGHDGGATYSTTYNISIPLNMPPGTVLVGTMEELADGVGPYVARMIDRATRRAVRGAVY